MSAQSGQRVHVGIDIISVHIQNRDIGQRFFGIPRGFITEEHIQRAVSRSLIQVLLHDRIPLALQIRDRLLFILGNADLHFADEHATVFRRRRLRQCAAQQSQHQKNRDRTSQSA